MLGKLIKNEFKANIHTIGMIYVVAAAAILIMMAAFIVKINWLSALATIVLIATGVLAVVMTFVSVVTNFKKTLFGGQGYLSFTLPVTSGQLLAAKTITSFCWMLLSYAVAIGVFLGVYLYATAMIGEDVKMALSMISMLFEGLPDGETVKLAIALAALIVFIRIVVLIAQLYFAITISNTRPFQKHHSLYAMLFMAVIGFVVIKLSEVVGKEPFFGVNYNFSTEKIAFAVGDNAKLAVAHVDLAVPLFLIIVSVGFFFITHYLMKKKINIG
jgi:hypothetical protein